MSGMSGMSGSGRSVAPFVISGLVIALFIGMVVSNFASSTPDALQRAIINSACSEEQNEAAKEACLAEHEGEPLLAIQPAATSDYGVTWFSGFVGVVATFAVGAGVVYLVRRTGGSSGGTSGRVR